MNWRRFFERKRRDEDFAREIESYVDLETGENIERGMSPEAARSAARRKFGNAARVREREYDRNTFAFVEALCADVKYGVRQLRAQPGFALAAGLSLALGIGANTAIFTLSDQIMLRLLPVRNPRELVQLEAGPRRFGNNNGDSAHTFSYPAYRVLQERSGAVADLTGARTVRSSFAAGGSSEMIDASLAAGNYFSVMGVPPHLGRLLTPEDNRFRNGHPVAVLQYDFWRTRFSGSPSAVGSTILLSGAPFTVIGVAAPGFEGPDVGSPVRVWVPVMMLPTLAPASDYLNDERSTWFYLTARLKPGITLERAQSALRVLYRQRQQEELNGEYFQQYPSDRDIFLRQTLSLAPAARGQSGLRNQFAKPLIVLEWLVGLILLTACANVANLLLARSAAREREIAVRTALGASRGRLVRQALAECAVLAVAAGAASLVLGAWLTRALIRMLPGDPMSLSLESSPDGRIFAFTALTTLATVFVFGLAPAWRGTLVTPGVAMNAGTAGAGGTGAHVRMRKMLIALQMGLASVLLIGAGLFARTLDNLHRVDLGFRTENVATFRVRPDRPYNDERNVQTVRALIRGLASVPGVTAVGANQTALLSNSQWDSTITIPGVQDKNGESPWSNFNAITPGYFTAIGIPVTAGRDLSWSDWDSPRRICLVNRTLVDEYLSGASPVGRVMAAYRNGKPNMEIVGVFGNAKYDAVQKAIPRQVFMSLHTRLHGIWAITVYARTEGDPRAAMPKLRAQVRRVDPNLVISDVRTLGEQLDASLSTERLLSFLSRAFAALATLLAAVGLYGVLAFVVARRRREIGIRMALGAERAQVVRLVAREMLVPVAAGLVAGVGTAAASGRFVEAQLFGVRASDPPAFAVGVAVLLAAALTASVLPALRASRVDPIRALRHE
jgi:predicted permease